MSARGRGNQEWDPMRDDYDNSTYDAQYADDSSSGYVNLDHCRLYITNIPKALNDEGIQTVFSKFGSLTESYVSKDPLKRYGLVSFETPGEAKLAMMKLNRTEPLRLNINIAHKKRDAKKSENRDRPSGGQRDRDLDSRSYRDDTNSVGSRSNHRRQDLATGDNMEELEDDVGLNTSLDAEMNLELEHLKLEHLKLQEAQVLCKHRMLLLKQAEKKPSSTSRCILPDGRIVVRNVEKEAVRDTDTSYGAGAGDSRVGYCVACGERAEAFCSRCGVTPYCSPACQRQDWANRHSKVCHNLKRSIGAGGSAARTEVELDHEPVIAAAAPLRRPRSPEMRRDDELDSDKVPPRRFGPPGQCSSAPATRGGYRNARGGMNRSFEGADRQSQRSNDDTPDRFTNRNQGGNDRRRDDDNERAKPNQSGERSDNRRRNEAGGSRLGRSGANENGNRRPQKQDDEDWAAKSEPQPKDPLRTPTFKPKPVPSQAPESKPQPKAVQEPSKAAQEVKAPVAAATVAAPKRTLVPKNCLIDLLPVNDSFTLSVDAAAAECRAGAGAGFVCVSLHEDYSEQYMQLLDDAFTQRCEGSEPCKACPGDTFAYLNPADGGWYRARWLAPARAALLDASKLVAVSPADRCHKLPAAYHDVPEFCCLLDGAKVQIADKLNCTVLSKSNNALTISLVNLETGAPLGNATIKRWEPEVDYPKPEPVVKPETVAQPKSEPVSKPASAAPTTAIPEVPRPPVTNNSKVVLVDATEPGRVLVRAARADLQRQFDDVVMEVALYGATATPLKEPPVKGQTVVAKFTDGNHYRALCRRVNSKQNKYLLEYIEYGNAAVQFLEELYPCPPELDLQARPTLASHVTLGAGQALAPAAARFLDRLKEDAVELTLTIPSGDKSAPSGSAVRLSVAGTGEDVARALTDLSTPEWKKLLQRGGDVLEVERIFFREVEYVDIPASGCELEITDATMLPGGVLAGHQRGAPHTAAARALADQLAEYCNSELCKDPYLPKLEELCIAKCRIKKQWLRAALLQQKEGAGGAEVDVLYYDYGHVDCVPVAALRKMMPEFARALPAAVCSLELRGFPKEPTEQQLEAARRFLRLDALGAGTLRVTRAEPQEHGEYLVDAPELFRAMNLV